MVADITEGQVQRALTLYMGGTSGQCQTFPNIMHGAFERDLLRLMKSGYWHEIEIKRTVSDFRADFKKSYDPFFLRGRKLTKHDVMQSGVDPFSGNRNAPDLFKQPKRFYFALPRGIVDSEEVPEPYGILRYYPCNRKKVLGITIERQAKDLPNPQKIDDETRQRFMTSIYCRFWAAVAAAEKRKGE